MNAAARQGDSRRDNIAAAHMLAEKLRITDEPLTDAERNTLAQLLYIVTERVSEQPRDSFDQILAWQGINTAFGVYLRILRGDLPEEGA